MQILGASVAQAVTGFLHPGYISAYPRTFEPEYGYPIDQADPVLQLDLVQALRLQDEVAARVGDPGGPLPTAVAGLGTWPTVIFWVACIFGGLAILAALRERYGPGRGARRYAPLLPLLAILVWGVTCGPAPLPTTPPWQGVTLRAYASPEQATRALLHGIIADGLINAGQPVTVLANLQNEVALPTTTPTEGMQYALQTYGIDGWGREFRLVRDGARYTVTSAGADGVFDTADDLRMTVQQAEDDSWDNLRHAFYVRSSSGARYLLIHRFPGDNFRYANAAQATVLTGGNRFDAFGADALSPDQAAALEAAWTEEASGLDHEPLLLQVFQADSTW